MTKTVTLSARGTCATLLPEELEDVVDDDMERSFHFLVSPEHAGMRLDHFLVKCFADKLFSYHRQLDGQISDGHQSRARIQSWIRANRVTLYPQPSSGKAIGSGLRVKPGLQIVVNPLIIKQSADKPESIPLNILYEDDELIVLDKPAGLVVHPAPGHASGTLVNALLAHCGPSLAQLGPRPGIVHRLDKDTSGVMIAAKTSRSYHILTAALARRAVQRDYLALVAGSPPSSGKILSRIGRHPRYRQRMSSFIHEGRHGREAETHFTRLSPDRLASLLNKPVSAGSMFDRGKVSLMICRLGTGRTHQIRVHMTSIGHPILGDSLYRRGKMITRLELPRQALHAWRLAFNHPVTKDYHVFEAPLAQDLCSALDMAASPVSSDH